MLLFHILPSLRRLDIFFIGGRGCGVSGSDRVESFSGSIEDALQLPCTRSKVGFCQLATGGSQQLQKVLKEESFTNG